jgi:hypothetical protein
MNQGQSMKHNRVCVTLQETLNETNKKKTNLELSFGTQELPIQKTFRGSTFPSGLFIQTKSYLNNQKFIEINVCRP